MYDAIKIVNVSIVSSMGIRKTWNFETRSSCTSTGIMGMDSPDETFAKLDFTSFFEYCSTILMTFL